jgi:DNA replication ATP-dependent helicase Dna2
MQADLLNELDGNGNALPRGARAHIGPDDFWRRGVGVVTPHRAQQALVLSELERAIPGARADLVRGAVGTVERFQGQQRDVIIVSYALGDPDAIAEEDEFLMSFNRFNVAASRARAKLIVLVSQQVISHLSSRWTSCTTRGCSSSSLELSVSTDWNWVEGAARPGGEVM